MFKKIYAIAINTFKETIRDRILYVIVLFAFLMCLLSVILGSLSIGNNVKLILDFGLSSINIFGIVLSIFIGTRLVFDEIERRTIYIILSKPINRWEFILGKFCGLSVTLTIVVSCVSVVFVSVLLAYGIGFNDLYLVVLSIFLIMLEIYLINALCILFSSFSSPLLSMAFVFSLWLIGHFNPVMLELAAFSDNQLIIGLANLMHYVLPDLSKFNIKNNIDNLNYVINYVQIFFILLYGILYTSILLMISMYAFKKKEFC